MEIAIANYDVIPEWNLLAKEVEPIFQAPMADDPEFISFMTRKIEQKEAIIARESDSNALMGLITISHHSNHISWFAVFEKYRNGGIGSKLLNTAVNDLGNDKVIEVTTFCEDYSDGIPARRLYQKFGFVDCDLVTDMNGSPRSLMKRFPKSSI